MSTSERTAETFLHYLISSGRIRDAEIPLLGQNARDAYPEPLAERAVEKGLLSQPGSIKALAGFYGYPYLDLDATIVEQSAIDRLSSDTARELDVLPFLLNGNELSLAMPSMQLDKLDRIQRETGCELLIHLADRSRILAAIELHYSMAELPGVEQLLRMGEPRETGDDSLRIMEVSTSLVMNALRLRASDIHIEAEEHAIRIRLRVDGVLREVMRLPRETGRPLASRFKVMADLDISETRHPQDGRISIETETRSVDLRIAFAPAVYGEKIVIRLLDRSGSTTDLRAMALSVAVGERLEKAVLAPNGIVLVTGPTGSGKSTTCYAILEYLNEVGTNIVTIEDPVEYRLEGLTQIQVRHDIGLDFSTILRSVLRQDPDIVLVGEIRDEETAGIAVQAALTGHLVLSTLHTNNALQGVLRLVEMGIDPFMVAPSLNGILAQRLARCICARCKTAYEPTPEDLRMFLPYGASPRELFRGDGCVDCAQTGYLGRLGIHEIVVANEAIRALVIEHAPIASLERAAAREGYRSMRYDGLKKTLIGLTTTSEIRRVTFANEDFAVARGNSPHAPESTESRVGDARMKGAPPCES